MIRRPRIALAALAALVAASSALADDKTLTGKEALGDWATDCAGRPPQDHHGRPRDAV